MSRDQKILLVFVHGLGGDPQKTWGTFLNIFETDTALSENFEVLLFKFPTSLFSFPIFGKRIIKIQELAEGLRTQIDHFNGAFSKILFVAHSLGGLIARKYIIECCRLGQSEKIAGLIMYGTPNNGSELANVGTMISFRHSQLEQLCSKSDFLESLNEAWMARVEKTLFPIKCIVGGQDRLVARESAIGVFGSESVETVLDKGHRQLVEPTTVEDLTYQIFRKASLSILGASQSRIEPAMASDPLFEVYYPCHEKFYLKRELDRNLSRDACVSNIWVSGPSGTGKTAAIKRALDLSGGKYFYLMMASYSNVFTFDELINSIFSEIKDQAILRFGTKYTNKYESNVNNIVDIFSTFFSKEEKIFIFIEEIPIISESMSELIQAIHSLIFNLANNNKTSNVRVLVSTINNPQNEAIKKYEKLSEYIKIYPIQHWDKSDTLALGPVYEVA